MGGALFLSHTGGELGPVLLSSIHVFLLVSQTVRKLKSSHCVSALKIVLTGLRHREFEHLALM